jgi:hypothetical protein
MANEIVLDVDLSEENEVLDVDLSEEVEAKSGMDGKDGYTPIKGVDYYTTEDIEGMTNDVLDSIQPTLEDIQATAETAETIAKGRSAGYVFDTLDDMNEWLAEEENTAKLNLGDNLYIREVDVPDYWWDGEQAHKLETQKVDLTEYAKFTDYGKSTRAGTIKSGNGLAISASTGTPTINTLTLSSYNSHSNGIFVGKGTLENIRDDYVHRGLVNNAQSFTADEQASLQEKLGLHLDQYATAEALQEVKDISETAETIAKGKATGYVFDTVDDMTTWLEDEENTSKLNLGDNLYIRATDVPDYWWDGESAQKLETQKVDLTNYVKNTDYASRTKVGVVKASSSVDIASDGMFQAAVFSLKTYLAFANHGFIGKGTLENIKEDYVKRALISDSMSFTDEELEVIKQKLGIS